MQVLGRYVDQAVRSLKADKAIAFHRLKEAWLEAVGPLLAQQAEPTKIRGGVLYVTVSSSAWSQEIQMQQALILRRLRSRLKDAPNRIACWVGQPHGPRRAAAAAEAPSESVPWADRPIPAVRQARIEETLATLQDEGQRARMRALLELAVRRELYCLDQGQMPCPECGQMRPPEQDACRECLRQRREEQDLRLIRTMARRPWMTLRELQERAPWADRSHLLRLRKRLHSVLLRQAWAVAQQDRGEALAAKMTPEYQRLLVTITQLRCYLREEALLPTHFRHALGQRIGEAFLMGRSETDRETRAARAARRK